MELYHDPFALLRLPAREAALLMEWQALEAEEAKEAESRYASRRGGRRE